MNIVRTSVIETGNCNRLPGGMVAGERSRPHRVWLVDDDEPLRRLLAQLLSRAGSLECCRGFSSPDLCLAALEREVAPDTILLDVHLGEHNGLDFIQPIKAVAPATRVLMLTTFYDADRARCAREAGASGFLVKSAPLEEIVACILQTRPHPQLDWRPANLRGVFAVS